ncbi:hypothetical protein FJW08_00315 [Mesorhizobium sp. B3-2-1]|nr:hypothetical protein FJW08_00315 [Mesorhizobium sp. B3-2-1]
MAQSTGLARAPWQSFEHTSKRLIARCLLPPIFFCKYYFHIWDCVASKDGRNFDRFLRAEARAGQEEIMRGVGNACLVFVGSLNREAPYFQDARGVGLRHRDRHADVRPDRELAVSR